MSEPVAKKKRVEYITKADLDAAMDAWTSHLDSKLEALKSDILLTINKDVDKKVAQAKDSGLLRLKVVEDTLNERVENEAKQRQADFDHVKREVNIISSKTHQELEALDKRLQPLISTVDRMTGSFGSWSQAMDANQKRFDEQSKKIEQVDKDIDDLRSKNEKLVNHQRSLHRTIHGNNTEDGPRSIFSMLNNIETEIGKVNSGVGEVKVIAEQNTRRLDKSEEEKEANKQKWTQRWETAKAFATSKEFLGIIALSIITIAVVIRPETQEFFKNLPLLNNLFG